MKQACVSWRSEVNLVGCPTTAASTCLRNSSVSLSRKNNETTSAETHNESMHARHALLVTPNAFGDFEFTLNSCEEETSKALGQ
jgi:hypothetical protein